MGGRKVTRGRRLQLEAAAEYAAAREHYEDGRPYAAARAQLRAAALARASRSLLWIEPLDGGWEC